MLKLTSKIWNGLRNLLAKNGEKDSYSSGYWPTKIRDKAVGLLPCAGTLLEVGCGEGIFLAAALKARPGLFVFGVDTSSELLVQAEERLKGSGAVLKAGDGLSLPFPDNSFNTAVCINVLLNLPGLKEAQAMVRELNRVTKPGGIIIFDIRNRRSLLFKVQYSLTGLLDPEIKVPLNTYRIRDFEGLLGSFKLHYIGSPKGRFAPVIMAEGEKVR